MLSPVITKSILLGALATLVLLAFYFALLTLVSGFDFTRRQFSDDWYFILILSLGFGTQIGLYSYLRAAVRLKNNGGKVIAVSGTTSTAAMISCCSHYLVNVLPVVGITGFITFVSQYQTKLFWLGIITNFLGIAYMLRKVVKFSKA